jgi:hypothetical protein
VAPVGVTFAESFLLLVTAAVLGALLTGVLAPIVVLRVNRARNREQKVFEEELSRDTAFVNAQAELLKELAAALWSFQAKLLAVSYAGAYVPDQFDEAWEAYNSNEGLDHPLSAMATSRASQKEWLAWHNPHHRAAEQRTATLLAAVADDAGLSFARRSPSHERPRTVTS